ncbi:MAG: phage terminase small subunit [Pseudomonadota bacterium]|nr:phage terminase small subunit [Pseudomonadota bacterium]
MALSPARAHQQRMRAAQAAAHTPHGEPLPDVGIVEQLQMQLANDRARLKHIQSTEGKVALKRELIAAYQPYIDGVLDAGQGAEDPILAEMLIWHLDTADWARALQIGQYLLHWGIKLPDRFARSTGCLIAEEIAEAALTAQRLGEAFPLQALEQAATLTAESDMPDEVRAKLLLATARTRLADTQASPESLEAAIASLKRAIGLHPACGGKKDLEKAERLLKKHAAQGS